VVALLAEIVMVIAMPARHSNRWWSAFSTLLMMNRASRAELFRPYGRCGAA
jgi:hypothetical protein